jgi:hypothetical protein
MIENLHSMTCCYGWLYGTVKTCMKESVGENNYYHQSPSPITIITTTIIIITT